MYSPTTSIMPTNGWLQFQSHLAKIMAHNTHTPPLLCELDNNPNGMKAKESFLAYSEEDRTRTVLIEFLNTPFSFPLVQNVADFSLTEQGNNQSVVTFSVTSTLKPLAFIIYPIIKFGFGFFVKQIVEELKFYV